MVILITDASHTGKTLLAQRNVNIVAGTVIEKDGDGEERKLYNTAYAIDHNGDIVVNYRKIHLFNFMGGTEGSRITPDIDLGVVRRYRAEYPIAQID